MIIVKFIKDEGALKKDSEMEVDGYVALGLVKKGLAKIVKSEEVEEKKVVKRTRQAKK